MQKHILSEQIETNGQLNSEEDQAECEAEVVYSSLSRLSDQFTTPKEPSANPLAHPRNTSKYLEQQKQHSGLNTPRSSNG